MGIFLDSLFFLTLHTCMQRKGLKERVLVKVKMPPEQSVSESLKGIEEVVGEGLSEGKKNVIGSYKKKSPCYVVA